VTTPKHNKLAVLSYRCQALLYYKLFKMKKHEAKEYQKMLSEYFNNKAVPLPQEQQNQQGQGTPSPMSPTPSPAGSVGSVGSQSSGYSSGELAARGNNVPPPVPLTHTPNSVSHMWIPQTIYHSMYKQNQNCTYLLSCHDLWDMADALVKNGNHTDFFIGLDRYCKPLTIHTSLKDLVRYIREGLKRLDDKDKEKEKDDQ
jgi:hypothetical protein